MYHSTQNVLTSEEQQKLLEPIHAQAVTEPKRSQLGIAMPPTLVVKETFHLSLVRL